MVVYGKGRFELIIDSHLHLNLRENRDEAAEKLLHDFKLVGIERSCLMRRGGGFGYLYCTEEDTVNDAEDAVYVIKRYPNTFYYMSWINGILPVDFLHGFIKKYIVNGPLTGVKMTSTIKASDRRLEDFAALLEKYDIPLLYHCWYKTVGKKTFESDPKDITCLARKFPELRILCAHLTGCRYRGIQEIKSCPNVFVDTSGSQPENGYLEYGIRELGADRILFGSDGPGRDFATQLARIDSIDMDEETRDKILYKNSLKFFEGGGSCA